MTWTVTAKGEIVGRAADFGAARRGCQNDMGRTLIIHDPIGRIAAIYRDGRDISEDD